MVGHFPVLCILRRRRLVSHASGSHGPAPAGKAARGHGGRTARNEPYRGGEGRPDAGRVLREGAEGRRARRAVELRRGRAAILVVCTAKGRGLSLILHIGSLIYYGHHLFGDFTVLFHHYNF